MNCPGPMAPSGEVAFGLKAISWWPWEARNADEICRHRVPALRYHGSNSAGTVPAARLSSPPRVPLGVHWSPLLDPAEPPAGALPTMVPGADRKGGLWGTGE